MIKYYDWKSCKRTHTVRVTFMVEDFVGHIEYLIGGNCKGMSLLSNEFYEIDSQDDIDRYVLNDCDFSYDEDNDCFHIELTNDKNETYEYNLTESEISNIIVAVEFANVQDE